MALRQWTVEDLRWALREHVDPAPSRKKHTTLQSLNDWMDANLHWRQRARILAAARERYLDHNPHRRGPSTTHCGVCKRPFDNRGYETRRTTRGKPMNVCPSCAD